ncbi:MAG TPA: fructosamine kinase family protein [Steroidobacteraceae bacterium]|nr:fructosamine kinase family protein [Steroidobacteraceae bacterium]
MTGTFEALARHIGAAVGMRLQPSPAQRIHGGSISTACRWNGNAGPLFVKIAPAAERGMLEAEAEGLLELKRAQAVRVPEVLAVGADDGHAWLALEWIEFGPASTAAETELGRRLALQHRRCARAFGWHRDNTIGRTPQANHPTQDWLAFVRERRLRPQIDRAHPYITGRLRERCSLLLERLGDLLGAHRPCPSLVHGDLWGGNWGVDAHGDPVVFDPAVYYGDREVDLAMTRLFGGFGPAFYRAYAAEWPLEAGADARADLYNLYHVLNHLNLFGAGYLPQVRSLLERVLAETGH